VEEGVINMAIFGPGNLPKKGDPGKGSGAPSRVSASRQGSNSETKSSFKTSSKVGARLGALARKRKLLSSDQQSTPGGNSPVTMSSKKGNPAAKTVGAFPAGKKFPAF
jgi:hypothetical protein